ncbi:MAG: peptidyl-prolyl cis-trans isomerase [Proteobacteria bacterium]|nr:peptidyl-prolyl cis-trans isomerase [Pseudomonadota bacterium]
MFEFIRKHTKLTLAFLLLLIIPSFVFFGIEGYSRFTSGAHETVAKVAGHTVTRAEWDQAQQRLIERVRRQPGVDASQFDTPQARLQTLDALLRERTLLAAAQDQHLAPSDARLQRLFATDPQFAALRNPDGSVNRELLSMQGLSSEMFAAQLRQDYAMRQVLGGIESSALAPRTDSTRALDALLQRREIQFQRLDPAAYRARVAPSDADIEAYYKAHEAQFRAPEQAQIQYVVLDLDALGQGVAVSEADARKFYDDNAARYTAPEERRASHILVKADQGTSAAERAKAKAKAEALLEQARKNPGGFAELAKKDSDDAGSAAEGGDLGWFRRGAMVKPFEDAVFGLKAGELSGVVHSDFGYHVIKLTGVRGGERKPFDQVKAEIESDLRRAQTAKRWPEAAEQFTNMAYEQPDNLQPLVDKFKLQMHAATVTRLPAPGATGALASAKLLDAVFSTDALRNQRNTDAIEIGPNQLAAAHVVKYEPARTLPLAEVRERVRDRVVVTQEAALARQDGEARVDALRKAPTEGLGDTAVVSRTQAAGQPPAVLDAALRADANKLPAVFGVDLGNAGYVVVRVVKVLPPETPPGGDEQLRRQYAQLWGAAEAEAYLAALKKRYKAEILPAARAASAPD